MFNNLSENTQSPSRDGSEHHRSGVFLLPGPLLGPGLQGDSRPQELPVCWTGQLWTGSQNNTGVVTCAERALGMLPPPKYLWGRRCLVQRGVREALTGLCAWALEEALCSFGATPRLSGSKRTWPRTDSFCLRTWPLEPAPHGSLCHGPGTGSWGSQVSTVLRRLAQWSAVRRRGLGTRRAP